MQEPPQAPSPKDVLLFLYDPKKTFVHVLVRMRNTPGALADVAKRAGDLGLNVRAGFSSVADDGTGVWSFFAECPEGVRVEKVKRALAGSELVLDVAMNASEDGLLVDQMHYPLRMTPSREFIGLNTVTASSMFRRVVSEFGSGGAVIIYEEGLSVGKEGGGFLLRILGREVLRQKIRLVSGLLSGWGWGRVESMEVDRGFTEVSVRETGSFEAVGARSSAPVCHFTRGMLAGFFEVAMGSPTKAEERTCIAQGAPACEFLIARAPR